MLKDKNNFLINLLILVIILILFFKFFITLNFYPLHDELAIVERNTEWQNFIWRNHVSNHTINSFLAVTIKSFFGYNLLFYRFFSFLFFIGILFLMKKLHPNILIFSIIVILILSSNVLTNYTWIFRGYYAWAFFTVLNFYVLKSFNKNLFDNKNFKFLMIINLILSCHALYVLYTVIPTLFYLALLIIKNKDKEKIFIFVKWFFLPLIFFYLIVITLEGFTLIFSGNLNFSFLLNNFFIVLKEGFIPGFKSIFLSSHINLYSTDNNIFLEVFRKLKNPPYKMESEYTIIFIYLIALSTFLLKCLKKKNNYLDFIFLMIVMFFYLIDKNPEPRQHIGIVYFMILYIFDFFDLWVQKTKIYNILGYLLFCITIVLTVNTNLNEKFYDTKTSINKINKLYTNNECNQLNKLLNDYEIWVLKNTHIFECNSYYDFQLKKNILTN
jgi:hypothetical protein